MTRPADKIHFINFPRPPLVLHDGFLSPAPSFPLDPLSTWIPAFSAPTSPAPLPLASLIDCDLLVDVDDDPISTPLTNIVTPLDDCVLFTAKSPKAPGQPLGPPPEPEANGNNPQRPPIRPNAEIRSRFDQEPNPFEVSFRDSRSSIHSSSDQSDRNTPPRGTDATSTRHNALPPLSSLTSPAAADPSQFPWLANSLRSGPLSPAMLAGPQSGNPQNANASNRAGGSNDTNNNANNEGGAFESNGFRTGFTPGTGSGFTPAGYNSFMGPGLGSLAMPSPNTAAFLNSITNSTPLGENSDVAAAAAAAAANGHPGHHDGTNLQPPSAIPPHLQQHHPLPHNNSQNEVPQETITPNTLSALTGVFGEMARANSGSQGGPPFYASAMAPPHPGAVPVQMPHVDYAQQSANAASQAANGLFLLSQAHQELSKREEEGRGGTPTRGRGGKASNGQAGQKRKSDVGPTGATGKPAKKGKKNSLGANAAAAPSPPKPAKQEMHFDSDGSDHDDDDGPRFGADGKPETEEDKRKNFLERNRQAALKCRQRKKAWLNELQGKVEGLTIENERLQQTVQSMHEEVGRLTAILMQHRDCGLTIPTAYGRPIR
ncbi:uncharacterized protein I303_103355 [Kwoniella dejecticola CBS 10117]|uniref:Activating transcription factor, other eukaryote n=1 Tax=Kwoniella dejecticola CBS 10117 TaxID=1296121 RepID=A0A1A6A6I0_9TREE|nr:activating transcription factor, other eukaryote [Kwoniella dejecticola CBS 10117]OBR85667.1 activating transcription factor, other eukaryote [Kwoniella dejecticola CBS 10117]